MSSSVCQGLQSCLEPCFVVPHVPLPKLAPPKSNSFRSFGLPLPGRVDSGSSHEQPQQFPIYEDSTLATTNSNIMDLGSREFFLGIVKTTHYSNDSRAYIHPAFKHSSSSLSQKSLEMCTESLGSETGSDYGDEIYLKSRDVRNMMIPAKDQQSKLTRETFSMKKSSRRKCFPPPLSSISRFGGFQVRSQREGGRLIIWAASVPSYHHHFHVERSGGRLRLGLLNDESQLVEQEMVLEEKEDVNGSMPKFESDGDINIDKIVGYNKNEEEPKQEEDDGGDDIFKSEKNRESVGFIRVESRSREFRRCNESSHANKRLLKWEPFLLAT